MKKPIIGISASMIYEEKDELFLGDKYSCVAYSYVDAVYKSGGIPVTLPILKDVSAIREQVKLLDGLILSGGRDVDPHFYGEEPLEKLEAMTAICSVGLDMIAIPEDTPAETIAAMIADEAAIGVINMKTTAVRIIPKGKEGDMIEFGGLLGTAPVMKVNGASSVDFISRGGQIPAPIHSFKN